MTPWFLDASALLASEDGDDPQYGHVRGLLAGRTPLATLDLAYYEILNVASRVWQDDRATASLTARLAAVAGDGGIVRVDEELIDDAIATALSAKISVYDAAYVAGARRSGTQLVSCDVRDLVSKGLAVLPEHARSARTTSE